MADEDIRVAEAHVDTATYLEPHEGVTGTDRPGDPLLTSDEAAALVARLTRKLYSTALAAHAAPRGRELFERMATPEVGDQVVVSDSVGSHSPETRQRGVGYLVAHRAEWWSTREEWERDKAEDGTLTEVDRLVEHDAWYVQYGPNSVDICRWVNCTVLAIP